MDQPRIAASFDEAYTYRSFYM